MLGVKVETDFNKTHRLSDNETSPRRVQSDGETVYGSVTVRRQLPALKGSHPCWSPENCKSEALTEC